MDGTNANAKASGGDERDCKAVEGGGASGMASTSTNAVVVEIVTSPSL